MKISNIVLAEDVNVDQFGRCTLVGAGIARVFAETFPCVVPSMCLFLRFVASGRDEGINRLEIRLVGRDGPFFRAEGSLSVTDDSTGPYISLPVYLENTTFKGEGRYDFQVFINGELSARQPIQIEQN